MITAVVEGLPPRLGQPAMLVSAALTLAGGICRTATPSVVVGGDPADDPQATLEMTG